MIHLWGTMLKMHHDPVPDKDGWTDEGVDGWMDGWTDKEMDGWIDEGMDG